MRHTPLPIALFAALALAAPASAAEAPVSVGNNFFQEATVRIQPGDSVKWSWAVPDAHMVTASADQTIKFDSGEKSSGSFSQTFTEPGRFRYFCELHPTEMRGTVEVGSAPFPDTSLPRVASAKARAGRASATVRFRLSEAARVRLSVRGPSRKTVTRSLGRGSRSLRVRGLKPGRYRATLTVTDKAGNKGRRATARFRVSR